MDGEIPCRAYGSCNRGLSARACYSPRSSDKHSTVQDQEACAVTAMVIVMMLVGTLS